MLDAIAREFAVPVAFIDPAERAWSRTRRLLFRPIDVERWIVIGFAAFLAGLSGQWAGVSFIPRWSFGYPPDWDRLLEAPFDNLIGAVRGSGWPFHGVLATVGGLLLGVALLWLSSRGKLILLDNLLVERAAFVDPWKRWGRYGDSLFLWRLGLYGVALAVLLFALAPLLWLGRALADSSVGRPFGVLASLAGSLGLLALGIALAYVALLLDSFVVPLMLRDRATAAQAWRRLLPLLRSHPMEFAAYGLVVLVGGVAVFLGLIAAAIATCCILPLLLSVPYLRSVLLLPLTGFFRLYGVEFLAQFGPEFTVYLGDGAADPLDPGDPATDAAALRDGGRPSGV